MEYDADNDAAYLRLMPGLPGIVDHSVEFDLHNDAPPIVFGITSDGRIAGIEVLAASRVLDLSALGHAG